MWAIVGLSIIEPVGPLDGQHRHLHPGRLPGHLSCARRLVSREERQTGRHRTWGSLKPSITGFLAVVGLLQFLFVGFELLELGERGDARPAEGRARHDRALRPLAALIVLGLVFGILLVIPLAGVSNVSGFPDAYNAVKSVLGGAAGPVGWLMGVMIIVILVSAGGVWLQGAARTQAVAGLDGAAPLFLGKFSKSGTPIAMNIASAIIGSIFVVLVFVLSSGSWRASLP